MMNFFKKEMQLEIFDTKTNANEQGKSKFLLLFQNLVKYEKEIFSGIAIIITFLIAFSIGFEKGKHINMAGINKPSEQINNVIVKENVGSDKNSLNKNKENTEPIYVRVVKKEVAPKGAYVIQVATYFKNNFAKKEAFNLKNKGFNPQLKNKGKFVILYVGNFTDKANAENSLKKLKLNYHDCFIKKLS